MGYDLHITRAGTWTDSAIFPIPHSEWTEFVGAEPCLERDEPGPAADSNVAYAFGHVLRWSNGEITAYKAAGVGAALADLAGRLRARVLGDDDEEYHADGSVNEWSAEREPTRVHPLTAEEVPAVWQTIFERALDDAGGGFGAREAMSAFRRFAERPVDVTETNGSADRIRFRFGPVRRSACVLQITRHLTFTHGAVLEVGWRAEFVMRDALAGIEPFDATWTPGRADGPDLASWFATLEAGKIWRTLSPTTPVALGPMR